MEDSNSIQQQRSANVLLQPFRKWTTEHVKIAKAQVIENVSAQELIPGYVPDDDEPGMQVLLWPPSI